MPFKEIVEPWRSFLSSVDEDLQEDVALHCLGGCVVTMLYGLARSTTDVDVITIAPGSVGNYLRSLAGKDRNFTESMVCIWTSLPSLPFPKTTKRD